MLGSEIVAVPAALYGALRIVPAAIAAYPLSRTPPAPLPAHVRPKETPMAIVSIPTVMRVHTAGAKSVEATGTTIGDLISDLEAHHCGIAARLVADGKLHRFVNIYVDDMDVRFADGLNTPVPADANVTILPAVAGG